MMLISQLSSDDFRNIGQALMIPSTSSQPIKHLRLNPGLGRLLLEYISRIEVVEKELAFRR